jgi:hypothetical protein
MRRRRFLIVCGFLLCSFAVPPAGAEELPLSRVGRVSAVDGTVAIRPAGGAWSDSGVNDPVAAGMSVRTAPQGRAVLRIGAETIALAPATELDVARLDAGSTQLVLRRGRIGVRLAALDPARSIEIDMPRGGVWLLTRGDYDIAAGDERAPARLAVFDGRARFVGNGLDTAVATGSANLLSGSDPVIASLDGAAADDFVAWWRPPGGAAAEPQALAYVSTEMTGYEALDANGSWETVAGSGAVWFPYAQEGWAPYRDGHWRWIAPWGWSWIDDLPWGFAPSHYGRWARFPQADPFALSDPGPERWGWVPGRPVAHPDYAPALVAFLGTAGVGLSYPDAVGPAVAWFPLAPGEVYWPAYTGDLGVIRRLNEGAVADVSTIAGGVNGEPPGEIVNGRYRNRRFASVVARSVFTTGRPVAPSLVQLPAPRLDNAPLLAGSPQIAPPTPPRAVPGGSIAEAASRNAASPGLAHAGHAFVHLPGPPGRARIARAAILMRPTFARPASVVPGGQSRWPGGRLMRPRQIVAVAPRPSHQRLHFAAAGHRITAR